MDELVVEDAGMEDVRDRLSETRSCDNNKNGQPRS